GGGAAAPSKPWPAELELPHDGWPRWIFELDAKLADEGRDVARGIACAELEHMHALIQPRARVGSRALREGRGAWGVEAATEARRRVVGDELEPWSRLAADRFGSGRDREPGRQRVDRELVPAL